jgi:hypothetical protein
MLSAALGNERGSIDDPSPRADARLQDRAKSNLEVCAVQCALIRRGVGRSRRYESMATDYQRPDWFTTH